MAYTNRTDTLAERGSLMSYKMACADVVPGCGAVFEAESEEELLALVGAHANAEHADHESPGCEVVDQAISEG